MLDDFREWLSDNLRYILLGLAVVLILVIGFCVVRLITGSSGSSPSDSGKAESEISTEAVTEGQEPMSEESETQGAAAAGTDSLTRDDAAILTVVREYYTAAAAKDVATLETIVSPWNEDVQNSILQNDVIESYENISTYSKQGPVDGSYVEYVYFDGKITNIDTLVPSLSMLYLTTDETGSLIVSDRESSPEVKEYIEQVSGDADVQALVADVDQKCQEAQDADPVLKEFMASVNDQTAEDGEAGDDAGDTAAVGGEMTVNTEMLNIRQEPSTDSAIMGIVASGTTVTVLEDAGSGWCRISYDAGTYTIEGYVMTEYLTSSGTDTAADSTQESETQQSETDAAADGQTGETVSGSEASDAQV